MSATDYCACRVPARSPRAIGPDWCATCRQSIAPEPSRAACQCEPRISQCPGTDPVIGCTSAIDQELGLCSRCRTPAAGNGAKPASETSDEPLEDSKGFRPSIRWERQRRRRSPHDARRAA
jgi:hypothetical protein